MSSAPEADSHTRSGTDVVDIAASSSAEIQSSHSEPHGAFQVNQNVAELPNDSDSAMTHDSGEGENVAAEEKRPPLRLLHIEEEPVSLTAMLESLLFVAEDPVSPKEFASVLEVTEGEVETALRELSERYIANKSGLRIQESKGRFSLVTMPLAAQAIEDFLNLDLNSRLSSAALETLAIVAYKQPTTRSQIESVRGVDCGGVLRTLLQRELISEVGRLDAAGRPILYGVTELFMQYFGITKMEELPPLDTSDADLLWAATQLVEDGEAVDTERSK